MMVAKRMREASSAEQVNESAVVENEQMDEQVAQYLRLDSRLI